MLTLFLAAPSMAADTRAAYFSAWEAAAHKKCPARHIELMGTGHDELLAAFARTIPAATHRRATRIADYAHRCSDEIAGFTCEMAVYVDAYRRLGVFDRLVAFTCAKVKCEEGAICSQFPGRRPR